MKTLKLNFIGRYGTITKQYPLFDNLNLEKQLHNFVEMFLKYIDREGVRDVEEIVNCGEYEELSSVYKSVVGDTIEISFT